MPATGSPVPRLFRPGDPRLLFATSGALPAAQPRLFGDLASLMDTDPLVHFESLRNNSRSRRWCECAPGTKRTGTAVLFMLLVVLMYVGESTTLLGRTHGSRSVIGRPGSRGSSRAGLGGTQRRGASQRGGDGRVRAGAPAAAAPEQHDDAEGDLDDAVSQEADLDEGAAAPQGHSVEDADLSVEGVEEEEGEEAGEAADGEAAGGDASGAEQGRVAGDEGGEGEAAAGLSEDEYAAELARLRARRQRSEPAGRAAVPPPQPQQQPPRQPRQPQQQVLVPSDDTGPLAAAAEALGRVLGRGGARAPSVPAVDWARARIVAFQAAVMTAADGSALGSILPLHTQEEPYEQQGELSGNYTRLAEHGLLLTPHYFFSNAYNVTVDPLLHAWAATTDWAGGAAAGSRAAPSVALDDGSFGSAGGGGDGSGGSGGRYALWAPKAGVRRWGVRVPTRLAAREDEPLEALLATAVEAEIDPDAHARAVAPCVLEHMYAGTYFHDLDNLHRAIVGENRYPPLNGVMRGGDMRAVGRALFRPADRQPLPHVLTAFHVVVGDTGYLFANHDGRGNGGVRRINRDVHPGSHEFFRPIQCLYREFDHSRGGHDAVYREPVGPVYDEVIVLSQYWGQHVYHLYEEDFIRLAFMLDYARAHPHVRLHVKMHDDASSPHAWLTELMDVFGIAPSRAVWGSVAARIVHVPEGTPCGEPYAFTQVALREALRASLRMRRALDVWGDGRAVAYGFARGTSTATAGIAAASRAYLHGVHACVLARYAVAAAPASGAASAANHSHPLAGLMVQALAANAAQPPPQEQGRLPKVLLLERQGSRHVPNFGELREALSTLPVNLVVFGASEPGTQAAHLAAFSNVDVIVGPHGAGLTNAITSWPGTVMIEFIPDSGLSNLVYMQSGLLLGFDFQSFTPPFSSYYGPIRVDVGRVREAVLAAIG